MPRSQLYICPTCKSTNRIHAHPLQTTESFMQELPEDMPCGRRGCNDRVVKREILDNICMVALGIHHAPYFQYKKAELVVCARHRIQYDQLYECAGFTWEEI